ncbi:MAG: DnaJ domain-containing protein [Alphaproteobacteria bacterium]|jgi:DnaJ-domain-containing protein 1|nr:DnaJ domain-containing protein [Alphaproteobacteria bacterium]MBU0802689.1 DnaJ domain-containing protein [Alphaproteobacteria bacterium]MBU0871486.1 DnaJ domain-containing protein [Alphaproteobacteria bacterium]MBU1400153.1 DnaJ domain-containing protein [Alphaproteobacteria bacterium]MBU1591273.1 DnaJ domain-containing protein [Alphaproteobacteria bacterium]
MSAALGVLAALLVLTALAAAFLRVDASKLAGGLRIAGPTILGVVGIGLLLFGRAAVGGMLLSLAAAWYGAGRRRRSQNKARNQRSTVRTAALEMELDHDTGSLEGIVLAGSHESRTLGTMSLDELKQLYGELSGDSESRQLLETYLDGRFPAWREHAETDGGDRQGVAPGSGAMTKEEAYKILGLEAGAATADIRKAHRRLIQRLHPDIGGTSFLAARINEAKDVLLSNHG